MSSFDFSLYDQGDTTPVRSSKSKPIKSEKFDFDLYDIPETPEKSGLDTLKDYGKSALKGIIEGTSALGRTFSPLKEDYQGQYSPEKQTETLNEVLPTEDTFGQRTVRRGLKLAPLAVASPFGGASQALIRSGVAGAAGETTKELGGGELAQTIAELSSYMSPSLTKNLVEKGKYKTLINSARKFGLSDDEISPLIQSEFKQKWFSKLAKKTGKSEERLSKTKSALDRSYEGLFKSPDSEKVLSSQSSNDLLGSLSKIAEDLPSEVRSRISQDMSDLVKKPITGQSLINLWKDINYYVSKGERQIGLFKEPIRKAIGSLSPELEKDFGLVNDLYKKYYPMAKNLKPHQVDKFVNAAEGLGLVGSVVTWNLPAIGSVIGVHSARLLAREMLINPRFQQLTNKMMIAIKGNSLPVFTKVSSEMQNLIDDSLSKISKKQGYEKGGDETK